MIVLDASVAVKWYFPEPLSDAAIALLDREAGRIVGPDLLLIEVCGAFVRGANIDKSRRNDALTFAKDLQSKHDSQIFRTQAVSAAVRTHAINLALDLGHPLKDCLYLALAMELDCELVTADARFAKKAREVFSRVRVLGE